MRALIWILVGAVALVTNARAEDCDLGQRYMQLAQDRVAKFANDEAMGFLRQAIDVCPGYDPYERLGEIAAQSPQQEDTDRAVAAFIEAEARAPTAQARAQSLYQYASLLNRDGDPQNAYPLINQARALDPGRADIAELKSVIQGQVEHPTREGIIRALRYSPYKRLRSHGSATAPEGGSGEPVADNDSSKGGPAVNIPIHFDTASVKIDQQTKPNLEVLAHALSDPALQGRTFMFVGHSDRRGGDRYNVDLSLQRAESMSQSVIAIEPQLNGRILVEGRGFHEPIDPGSDQAALRANRRLQVIVK
jgi:outer membrane protein OmpA-like peptidoglycan-associated protein